MIDKIYIKTIIDSCQIEDFNHDVNGVVRTEGISEYIDTQINFILDLVEENAKKTIEEKCLYEITIAYTDKNATSLMLLFSLTIAIYDYLISKYYNDSVEVNVLSLLVRNSIHQYQAILVSYLSGSYIGILTQIRMLYENYITYMYIRKYRVLAKPFQEHAEAIRLRIQNIIGIPVDKKDTEMVKGLGDKYGDDYFKDYGWTKEIIKKMNDRKLITMVKDIGLNDYSDMYRISSNYIHPSSWSIMHDLKVDDPLVTKFIASSVELVTNHIIHFMRDVNCIEKDRILIMNILYGLREELYDEPSFSI